MPWPRRGTCEMYAPTARALCCTLKAPQNPPLMSHCSEGDGPTATAWNLASVGGVHTPGFTQCLLTMGPCASAHVRGEPEPSRPCIADAGAASSRAQSGRRAIGPAARGTSVANRKRRGEAAPRRASECRFINRINKE